MAVKGYTSHGTPVPAWWVGEVERAKKWRRERAKQDQWERWRRWYRGEWDATTLPSNVYFKMIRTLIPRIYYRNPSVSITPTVPGVENMLLAKLLERADNKLITLMDTKGQMKSAVQRACMFGTSALRLGYGAEFSPSPDDLDTAAPDAGTTRLQNRVEYNDLIRPNMPWVLSTHPRDFCVPEHSESIHTARWVCYETVRTTEDVQDDPRLRRTSDIGEGPQSSTLVARNQQRPTTGVTLWEIRDKKTGLVFVIAPYAENLPTGGRVLYVGEDELQINGRLPLYPLIFNHDDEAFWGVPDSQIVSPQQAEKNEIRTQLRNHRRVAIAKFLYEKGNITSDELSKMTDGNAQAGIAVNSVAGIHEFQFAGLAQIMQLLENTEGVIDDEIQQLLGLGVNQFGEYAPGSADRSATEATIVAQATQIRVDERRDACADLLVEVVTDLNQIIMTRWPDTIVADIVGPAGVPIWIEATRDQLATLRQGGAPLYTLKVDPDSSLPSTKALREQKAVQNYGLLKTNPLINPIHLTQYFLTEMYSVADADFLLNQPLFNTSQQNPMPLGQAADTIRALPPPNMQALQQALSAPAQVIPPGNIS